MKPDIVKKLIEGKTYANVATIMPDGSPQVTQTWVARSLILALYRKSLDYSFCFLLQTVLDDRRNAMLGIANASPETS